MVFRPRVSEGQYIHPTGNEDVRPHVEHAWLLSLIHCIADHPAFTLKQVEVNEGLELRFQEVTQKTNCRPSVGQIEGFG